MGAGRQWVGLLDTGAGRSTGDTGAVRARVGAAGTRRLNGTEDGTEHGDRETMGRVTGHGDREEHGDRETMGRPPGHVAREKDGDTGAVSTEWHGY